MDLKTPTTVDGFLGRVRNCRTLTGLEVQTIFLGGPSDAVQVLARHPYGPWAGFTIFACNGTTCESENGAPMCASDVAFRLRRLARIKPLRVGVESF